MRDELEKQVIEIIARKKGIPPEALTSATPFAQIGLDSLDAIDLVFTFEDTFAISIPDDVAQQMKTVGQTTAALREVLSQRAAGAG
jgi:acyl carrier protein